MIYVYIVPLIIACLLADGNSNFGDVEIHAISSLLKLFLVSALITLLVCIYLISLITFLILVSSMLFCFFYLYLSESFLMELSHKILFLTLLVFNRAIPARQHLRL